MADVSNKGRQRDFVRHIKEYMRRTFPADAAMRECSIRLELEKIEQQECIQIPFLKKYLLRDSIGMRVLDVGCGTGGASVAWELRGAHVIGTDVVSDFLRLAPLRARAHNVSPSFRLVRGTSLPFKQESFDLVICDQVLEHVSAYTHLLQEMNRVAKKGAILYVDLPNRFFPFDEHYRLWFVHWLPASLHRFILKLLRKQFYDYPVFYRTRKDIVRAIESSNWRIVGTTKEFIISSKDASVKYALARILVRCGVPTLLFSPTLQFVLRKV